MFTKSWWPGSWLVRVSARKKVVRSFQCLTFDDARLEASKAVNARRLRRHPLPTAVTVALIEGPGRTSPEMPLFSGGKWSPRPDSRRDLRLRTTRPCLVGRRGDGRGGGTPTHTMPGS